MPKGAASLSAVVTTVWPPSTGFTAMMDGGWRPGAPGLTITMSPGFTSGGTIAMPNRTLKLPPSATRVCWPLAGFTRITPLWPPAQHAWSVTNRSPFAAMATPTGPAGLAKKTPDDTSVWLWPGGWLLPAGFTRITPPVPPPQQMGSATNRSPFAAMATPTGPVPLVKKPPDDTGVWLWPGGWLLPAGFTRITPPAPPQHTWSVTSRSSFAAMAIPVGETKWPPDDTSVWSPVAGFTRITPALPDA